MLTALIIRDVVLIESLDLTVGPGLTALTGETGAGKSIILDALGLATGARADAGLVRRGATQAVVTAMFDLPQAHAVWPVLEEKGLTSSPGEELILRRVLSADGRSRAFVNDQAASVGVLKELGNLLLEVHGQHETVGLLDPRNHRPLLDHFGGCRPLAQACSQAWEGWRQARQALDHLRESTQKAAADIEEISLRLAELDLLAPMPGEETELAGQRALLGSAEKALTDIAAAREGLAGDALANRLAQAFRALERARERALQSGAASDSLAVLRLTDAANAVDRALVETQEAASAIDAAA
ncbi:MAG: hypothetical protein RLZZ141_2251, partial [Pseudomonadota bacterium]